MYAQNSAFAENLYPCPNRRDDNPEQFADFLLGHGGCTDIGRQGDIALPVDRDNVPFFFHRYAVLRLLNGSADILLHLLQLVRQGFHVLTYLLGGDFCVNLGSLYVSVTEKPADGFNGYTVG